MDEDSIRIIESGNTITDESKVWLWRSHIAPSLKALQEENKTLRRSLGIIQPDPGNLRFFAKLIREIGAEGQAISEALFQQNALFENPLTPLEKPEFAFGYRFTSAGHPHEHVIHDWEVQAAYREYRRRYGHHALDKLQQEYGQHMPTRNLHFILGTMKAHPTTFIIIGLLRSPIHPTDLDKQLDLF